MTYGLVGKRQPGHVDCPNCFHVGQQLSNQDQDLLVVIDSCWADVELFDDCIFNQSFENLLKAVGINFFILAQVQFAQLGELGNRLQ